MPQPYKTSADYINNLTFDYVETYSFRRGEAYEAAEAEYKQLQTLQKDRQLSPDEQERYSELQILFYKQFIIDENRELHPYSTKTHTFQHDHPIVQRIKEILQTEIVQSMTLLCEHIYRDAFVFYDHNHQIVSSLDICLSCFDIRSPKYPRIKADYKTFDYLKKLFLGLGHDVENPEYSLKDDIDNQIERIKNRKKK